MVGLNGSLGLSATLIVGLGSKLVEDTAPIHFLQVVAKDVREMMKDLEYVRKVLVQVTSITHTKKLKISNLLKDSPKIENVLKTLFAFQLIACGPSGENGRNAL